MQMSIDEIFHKKWHEFYKNDNMKLMEALREIDTHIRSTDDPIPYIVKTLKSTLPEYEGSAIE